MKKIISCAILIASFLSLNVYALGTADAEIHSSIGEKLLIEIPLKGTADLSDDEILIQLANLENYQRLGVEYHPLHQRLRFKIIRNENNEAIVLVSTPEPFNEPFINFVIHIKTPASGVIKEFSLLLDTPKSPKK